MNGGGTTDRLDRRIHALVHAYPVPWRRQRSEELVDTIRDTLGPRPTRIG